MTLGDIQWAFRFDYQLGQQKGWARGRVLLDQDRYFVKQLIGVEGLLEWNPTEIGQLTASRALTIDYSEPTLSDTQRLNYELVLNGEVGDKTLKTRVLAAFNSHYSARLKTHLNSEHLAANTTIRYPYKNFNVSLINAYRNYTLVNRD